MILVLHDYMIQLALVLQELLGYTRAYAANDTSLEAISRALVNCQIRINKHNLIKIIIISLIPG